MSSSKLLGLLGAGIFMAASSVACAPASSPTPSEGEPQADESSLGSAQRSYVVARRDLRKCAWPMCSGWFVHDVNRKNAKEVYVASLDFAGSDLDEATAQIVTGAADGEVVLYGKLADLPDWDDAAMQTFAVKSAWRGMPGETFDEAADVFYATAALAPAPECFTAPCPTLSAKPLHKSKREQLERIDLDGLAEPLLDRAWLDERARSGGAIVAGAIVEGEVFAGGPEHVLRAAQVFVRLPEEQGACPQSRPGCPEGQSATYVRDENRCVVLSGCAEPGACPAYVPACGEGYGLVSWTGGMFACTVYACDPAFLLPEPGADPAADPPIDGGEG